MLHQLAHSGDVAGLRQHLENVVNSRDSVGNTPLLRADYTKPEILSVLLQYGADVHVQNRYEESPLHLAVKSKCVESVRLMLDAGVELELRNKIGMTALCEAVQGEVLSIAELLLERGADLNMKIGHYTVLNLAVQADDERMVNLLLEQGANLDAGTNEYGQAALFEAVRFENTTISRRFIELGANMNRRDMYGQLVLHEAAAYSRLEQVKLLVENGADVTASDDEGSTALHCAVCSYGSNDLRCSASSLRLIEYLLECGADLHKRNHNGATPLLLALQNTHLDIVNYLLERGADLRVKDHKGRTALHYAAENEKLAEMLKFVLDQGGFHVEDRTQEGWTALHCAAKTNADKCCAFLLRCGANVNAECNEGRSPLYYASVSIFKSESVMEMLLRHGAAAGSESILSPLLNSKYHYEESGSCTRKTRVLLRHLAKLECLDRSSQSAISTEDRWTIQKNRKACDYFRACVAELERMKVCKIFEDVSLLDIWTKSDTIIEGYARNEKLVQGFEEKNDENDFPIYDDIVFAKFNEVVRRLKTLSSE